MLFDRGDSAVEGVGESGGKIMEYFLTGVSLPGSAFWVNLRPDCAGEDIIDRDLEQTDVGKVFLEADLCLKRDFAMATSPATAEGRIYWQRLCVRAASLFGARQPVIPTVVRPWIVPGEIITRQSSDGIYIYKAVLSIRLEQERFLSHDSENADPRFEQLNAYSAELVRELILPGMIRRVNRSPAYAQLRQVYYSLIATAWYKRYFRGDADSQACRIDTRNLDGIVSRAQWSKTTYVDAYRRSFALGEYNLRDRIAGFSGTVVRRYVSGGIVMDMDRAQMTLIEPRNNAVPDDLVKLEAGGYQVMRRDGGVFLRAIVDEAIADVTGRRAPRELADDYRAGYLLLKDASGGGDSREGKIRQAQEHLDLTGCAGEKRDLVAALLETLRDHPLSGNLTLLQFEGVANLLVKKYSGVNDAYAAHKRRLDEGFFSVFPSVRDSIRKIPEQRDRLFAALVYAGIGNLMDLSHPKAAEQIGADLGLRFDFADAASGSNLTMLVRRVYETIREKGFLIGSEDYERFYTLLRSRPGAAVFYFLDNHGEMVIDEIVIEELLAQGFRVVVVARAETARDDVTVAEATDMFAQNPFLSPYITGGKLVILTDGSYLLGADLSRAGLHPEFVREWADAVGYIAKGGGNSHTLLGQRLSIPGLHVRMMKGSLEAYGRIAAINGGRFDRKSPYDIAFVYQGKFSGSGDGIVPSNRVDGGTGAVDSPGGIDLRGLSGGSGPVSPPGMCVAGAPVPFCELDQQWKEIRLGAVSGKNMHVKIKEYVEACCVSRAERQLKEVMQWISAIMKSEEERAASTDPELLAIMKQIG